MAYNRCFSARSPLARNLATLPLSSLMPHKTVLLSTNCPMFFFILQNPDNFKKLDALRLLPLSANKTAPLDIHAFFLLSRILRNYLVPLPQVEQEVAARLEGVQNKTVIGMHIRCGNPLSDFKDQSSFLSIKEISVFHRCKEGLTKNDAAIVVASDSTKAKSMISNYNPSLPVLFLDRKSSHTMTRYFSRVAYQSLFDAFVEMELLSRSTVLIGTQRSSFSLCAAALKGSLPLLVRRGSKSCTIPSSITFGWTLC